MIIQALSKYYEILESDDAIDIARQGFSSQKVSYALIIRTDGELLDVMPCQEEVSIGNKTRYLPRDMILPYRGGRSGKNPPPNFLFDNSKYVLGVGGDREGTVNLTQDRFESFKEFHKRLLTDISCDESRALLNFMGRWNAKEATSHSVLSKWLPDIAQGSNIVFRMDGQTKYIHEVPVLREAWEKYVRGSNDADVQQCLVSGEIGPIERLHPKIKGVRGTNSAGANIVSFNDVSYESYGKKQGANAPISEKVAFAYGTALNYLLSSQKQKIQIGDATTVFWAESPDSIYTDLSAALFNPPRETSDEYVRDKRVEDLISTVLHNVQSGIRTDDLADYVNLQTRFYILGLSPNAARISVRFFHQTEFGTFLEQIKKHYNDMNIVKQFDRDMDNIPLWAIINETVPRTAREKKPSPLLAGALMRSLIQGSAYPAVLLTSILRRIKADSEVNYVRAAIMKAFLLRSSDDYKEELTVELNNDSKNPAYRLGRLFAVLEKVQSDAIGTDRGIRDKYIASASSTPAVVFPRLLSMAQHHISKASYGRRYDTMIEDIIQSFEADVPFPQDLSLEEQGMFFIGYYHQRKALFAKPKTEEGGN